MTSDRVLSAVPAPQTHGKVVARVVDVLVVDDHERFRAGLERRLEADDRFSVAGALESVAAAIAAMNVDQPDVAVIDLNLPDGDALDIVAAIAGSGVRTRALIVSAEPDSVRARQATRLLRTPVASKELSRKALADLIYARAISD